ncbi:MAG: hypothetical protein ACK5V3_15825 [Bdellovibrionales bacterium]
MESVNNESKKKPQKIDRVVLDLESMAAVRPLQQQVNEQLGDLAQISLKDIVNFILQERVFILTEDELNKLKSKHFDLVKALLKATFEVIKAKQNGSELQLDQVLKIIQTPGVIQNSTPKRTIKRKKKTQDSVSMDQANLAQDTQTMKE